MIGFALIMIVVAVVILVFLAFSIRNNERDAVESYEAYSFLQSTLQYTTECRDKLDVLTIKDLIFMCESGNSCDNGDEACGILVSELEEIVAKSWPIGEDRPVKGYKLDIGSENGQIVSLQEGNLTGNSKGSIEELFKGGNLVQIIFSAYY